MVVAPILVDINQELAIRPPETDIAWQLFFWKLTSPVPFQQSEEFLRFTRQYERLLCAEMIRLKWGAPIRITGLPKAAKQEFKVRGELLYRLLNLISETWLTKGCGYVHPAEWLAYIWDEDEATCLHWYSPTKSGIVAEVRAQNSALTDYRNPFEQPNTKRLFDEAVVFANGFKEFDSNSYQPFVRARKAVATLIASKNVRAKKRLENGKMKTLRQGRKKLEE